MRVIVHTGKGGVGKTSVSAATALRCAEMGLKTIVISTDTAHSLGNSLETEIGPEPGLIAPNLWAQEVDTRYSMDKYWGKIQRYLTSIFTKGGVEDIVAEEVTILPGLEEGAHLLWINQYVESGEYDVLVVDAAPTAETLRLLSLPDVTRWWFERILLLTRGAAKILRPINSLLGRNNENVPEDNAWDEVRKLFDTLDHVREILSDPEIASVRLVVNPEKMVIKETQRTYTYLNLYGYATDAIICNRIIPDEVVDPYFAQAKLQTARKHRVHPRSLRRTADDDLAYVRARGRRHGRAAPAWGTALRRYQPRRADVHRQNASDHPAGRRLSTVRPAALRR